MISPFNHAILEATTLQKLQSYAFSRNRRTSIVTRINVKLEIQKSAKTRILVFKGSLDF